MKEKLQFWNLRNLTILGRIQIVKTFVIPIFMHRASLVSVDKDVIKEANKILIIARQNMYDCRSKLIHPSLRLFISKVYYIYQIGLDSSRYVDILRNQTTLFKFENMFRQKLLSSSV